MNRLFKFTLVVVSLTALLSVSARASLTASDNAADSAYSGGGNYNTLNGGTGFSAWSVLPSVNGGTQGAFIGSSTNNGSGSSGGIDVSGKSFGLYGNTGAGADAFRPFTGGSLSIGQSVIIDMDNGFIDAGGTVGLGLQTLGGGSVSTNRIEFYFAGGASGYTIDLNGSTVNSGVGFTADGLRLTFTLTAANTMNLTVGSLNGSNGGTNSTFTGLSLGGVSGTGIDQIHLFNFNAGGGASKDAFFNSLAVIPEPSTMMLVGCGLLGAWVIRRRR